MALERKIAYIDLTTGKIEIKPIPLELRKKFLYANNLNVMFVTVVVGNRVANSRPVIPVKDKARWSKTNELF